MITPTFIASDRTCSFIHRVVSDKTFLRAGKWTVHICPNLLLCSTNVPHSHFINLAIGWNIGWGGISTDHYRQSGRGRPWSPSPALQIRFFTIHVSGSSLSVYHKCYVM